MFRKQCTTTQNTAFGTSRCEVDSISHAFVTKSRRRLHIQRLEFDFGSLHFELVDKIRTPILLWDYHILDELLVHTHFEVSRVFSLLVSATVGVPVDVFSL